jgi:nucleoside-diphosphate-sugar epimerase
MHKVLVTGGLGEAGVLVTKVPSFECDVYDIQNGDDIWDKKKLVERMKGKDIVVHLAAYAHPFMEGVTDDDYWKLNFEGTKHVVSCMKEAGVKRIIFMSTGGMYGFSQGKPFVKYLPVDEKHPLPPEDQLTTYDKTKIACEEFLLGLKGIKAYLLRLEAPGLIDDEKAVYKEHLFAHVTRNNFIDLMEILSEYNGKNDVFNAGDAVQNKFCPNTIAFAQEFYPEAEIKLDSPTAPLYSVKKAQEVLGYKGDK